MRILCYAMKETSLAMKWANSLNILNVMLSKEAPQFRTVFDSRLKDEEIL